MVPDEDVPKSKKDSADLTGVVDLVKNYARQETLGPIQGAGKWLAMGAAGAVMIGFGNMFLVLGVLRLVQTEYGKSLRSPWVSIVSYFVALVATVIVMTFAAWRISRKKSLQKESR